MGFFKNRKFNLVYVHSALQAFAMHGGETFAFVYLLKAGIPAHLVLVAIGAMFGSRIIFRKAALPLVKRIGLRGALICGILAEAVSYPLLAQVTGIGPLLYFYLALWAVSSSLYWTTYHAYVALLGDNEHRGSQVSLMEFIGTFMGIVAPMVTGLLLTYFTPLLAFGVVGIGMACSAIPILLSPRLPIAPDVVVPRETRNRARLLLFTDGLRSGTFHFTWLIALFITLGGSFAAYGGAMTLAGIAGAAMGLLTGRAIDLGNARHAIRVGFGVLALAATARALGYPLPWSAVLANAAAAVAWPIYATALNSRMYVLARQSPCPLRYHIIAEGGWDLGTAVSCFASATLVYAGFSYFWPLALALFGCALGYWAFSNSFEKQPA